MATNRYSDIGEGGIVKEGIFVRFPLLIPSDLPNDWGSSNFHNKLMIVMESNYFKGDENSVYRDPEAWYKGTDTQHLIPSDKERLVINNKSGYTPFNRLCNSMNAVSCGFQCETVYEKAILYNYFLRPATEGSTFKSVCKEIDRIVAGIALCGILEIDKPDIVIFASKYAYDEFTKYKRSVGYDTKNVIMDFVYHPSAKFYKWDTNPNSKQKFEKLLKEYWLINK